MTFRMMYGGLMVVDVVDVEMERVAGVSGWREEEDNKATKEEECFLL